MSDILAKLRAAHDTRDMRAVHVPEYEVTLHFPPLTLADREKIARGVNPRDEIALSVSAMVHQARNADGTPAFPNTPEVKAELYRMEVEVLQRIMAQAQGGIGAEAAAEVAAVDLDVLRTTLGAALPDQPRLSEALASVDDAVLRRLLTDLAAAGEVGRTTKNA
jgi:hypothetical protein